MYVSAHEVCSHWVSPVNIAAQAQNEKDSSRVTQHSWGPHSALWHSKDITLWSQAHHAGPRTRDSGHWFYGAEHGPHVATQVLCPIPAVLTFPTLMALGFVSYFPQGI